MKILIIEDDVKISNFLQKGLTEEGFVVDTAGNGKDGLELALYINYSAIILDIMLPALDGISVLDILKSKKNPTPILILSAKRLTEDKILGLQKGADDYLTKPFEFAELLARIHVLIRRKDYLNDVRLLEYKELKLDRISRNVFREEQKIELQIKEFALLDLLMINAERVISKTYILDQVWKINYDPQVNIVDVLVFRLRNKIDKSFEKKLIHTIRGIGYVLREEI